MMIKRRLNYTNYYLQKSARSRPLIIHVDHICRFPDKLSKEEEVPSGQLTVLETAVSGSAPEPSVSSMEGVLTGVVAPLRAPTV